MDKPSGPIDIPNVSCFLEPTTGVEVMQPWPEEGGPWFVLRLGGGGGSVRIFAEPSQLMRLRDELTLALDEHHERVA